MSTYSVKLYTANGESSYLASGTNIQEVTSKVEQLHPSALKYTVEQLPNTSNGIPKEVMPALMNATGMLMACLILFVFAEYRIRKWLKS